MLDKKKLPTQYQQFRKNYTTELLYIVMFVKTLMKNVNFHNIIPIPLDIFKVLLVSH